VIGHFFDSTVGADIEFPGVTGRIAAVGRLSSPQSKISKKSEAFRSSRRGFPRRWAPPYQRRSREPCCPGSHLDALGSLVYKLLTLFARGTVWRSEDAAPAAATRSLPTATGVPPGSLDMNMNQRETWFMPPLDDAKHERFAQGLAAGKTAVDAYEVAGYRRNRGHASTGARSTRRCGASQAHQDRSDRYAARRSSWRARTVNLAPRSARPSCSPSNWGCS
jgi:hypothetical protein